MAHAVPLDLLTVVVAALAAAVLAFLIVLLVERGIAARRAGRAERREAKLTDRIHRVIQNNGDLSNFGKLSRFDRRVMRGMLLRLAIDLRGDAGEVIASLYQRLGFLDRDIKRLRSWRGTVRANAAADLGVIQSPEAVSALTRLLGDENVRVRQTAVWALGQTGGRDTLIGLVRLLGDSSRIVGRRVEEVLAERGNEVKEAILAYAEKTAVRAGRLAAIELMGWLRMAEGTELLIGFMSDLDPEVRIKSVKAASAIGDPRFMKVFHGLLGDARWEVRCQAAKGLSVFGSPSSIPHLDLALRDSNWWVRFYAATALAEVGAQGIEMLQLALRAPDQPVQDMARYLLERGDAVPALP
jgi:HEAT repeat protein